MDLSPRVIFSVLIFTLGFALKGVYPFGENSALVVDGVHQYTAFYRKLPEQLLERERAGPGPHMPWDIIFTDCFAIISAVRSAF